MSTVLENGIDHSAVAAAAILLAWSSTGVGPALLARRIPLRFSGAARLATGLVTIAVGLVPPATAVPTTSAGPLVAGLVARWDIAAQIRIALCVLGAAVVVLLQRFEASRAL